MTNLDPDKVLHEVINEIEPEPEFKAGLRSRIINLAAAQKSSMPKISYTKNVRWLFGLGSSAVALAVLMALFASNNLPSDILGGNKVASYQGFGKLPSISQNSGGFGGMGAGGGGTAATPATLDSEASRAAGGDQSKMIAPISNYEVNYSWSGTLPEIPENLPVFKDSPLNLDRGLLNSLAKITNLGLLKKSPSYNLENISFRIPNSPYHYNVDQSGRFSLWTESSNYQEVRRDQVPSDEELINIAKQFVSSQGIDTSKFGAPYVDPNWGIYYPADTKSVMVGQYITVMYPGDLDGKPIVGWNNQNDPVLSVGIDIVSKTVNNMSGRWQTNKQRSLYPVQSSDTIVEQVKKGGLNPLYYYGTMSIEPTLYRDSSTGSSVAPDTTTIAPGEPNPGTPEEPKPEPVPTTPKKNTINVELTEAKLAYIQQYKYNGNGSETYWIPVIAFSGSYTDEKGTKQQYGTIVPAIQSDFFNQNIDGPRPLIMEDSAK